MDDNQNSNIPINDAEVAQNNNAAAGSVMLSQPPTINKNTILIIEDDPVLSKMYSEKFKTEGFNIISAADGKSGLEMANNENIDMILLDIMLPRMSGVDLLEELRKSDKGKSVKVIVLTNLADPDEKTRAQSLGILEYLVKAMQTPEQVVNKVKEHLLG